MKKLIYFISLIILFSVFLWGCQKDNQSKGTVYTPYSDIINPPDTFMVFYNSVPYGTQLSGKIQFKTDAVWTINQLHENLLAWFKRADKTTTFEFTSATSVGLQGNTPYDLTVKNTTAADGTYIYLQFIKSNQSYDSFSNKY